MAQDVDRDDAITGYEVTGGADQNDFEITNTNELRFKEDPDFERPADAGGNNEYIVEVTATGGTDTREMTETQTITVAIEDEVEPPGKPDPPAASDETESSLTVSWTEPTNTGPDIGNYHVRYRDSGAFTDWPDTGPSLTRTITGLRSGTTYQIQVQAENAEGKGAWSNSVNGTTLTAPTVLGVAFTSTPASGQNNTYKLNDIIDVTVIFNEAVTVTGTPQIDLTIGTTVRQADYKSGSTTPQLLFQYTVQATDEDTDGASINANGLKLNGGSIKNNASTVNANLVHNAQTNQFRQKVDGVVPSLTDAEVTDDELTLTYSEGLDSDPKPATSDFTVTAGSEAGSVTAVAVSNSKVTLTLASAVAPDQTVTVSYTPGTNPIRDLAHNPAAALTDQEVTNETPSSGICGRTQQVRDAILASVSGVSACGDVTGAHLVTIDFLYLANKSISGLKAGDFSGLTALTTLELGYNQLTSLDAGLFDGLTALTTLRLYGNDLNSLPEGLFSGLNALTTLELSDNDLTSLDAGLFSGLTALTTLELSDNDLTSLDAGLFSGLNALTYLDLGDNELTNLDAGLFSGLNALTHLRLSNGNDLTSLPAGLFDGLNALTTLDLYDNDLTSLDAGLFSGLNALTHALLD